MKKEEDVELVSEPVETTSFNRVSEKDPSIASDSLLNPLKLSNGRNTSPKMLQVSISCI
jgi:hypothetical protein